MKNGWKKMIRIKITIYYDDYMIGKFFNGSQIGYFSLSNEDFFSFKKNPRKYLKEHNMEYGDRVTYEIINEEKENE